MPALKGDEVKKEKGLKNLTPNKLLTKLPVLLEWDWSMKLILL